MSKKAQKRKQRMSTAAATRKRMEKVKRGNEPQTFKVPNGMELFQLKNEKSVRIDIIPFIAGKGNPMADEGMPYWERTFWVHRNIGPNNRWFVCPARTVGSDCPICEYVSKLQRDPESDQEIIDNLLPSKRQLFNVQDSEDPGKVKLWDISHFYFGKQLDAALDNAYEDDDDNMDNFADPEGGASLKLGIETNSFSGKTSYKVSDITFKPRKEDLDEELVEKAVCLDDILIIPTAEEIKAAMRGIEDMSSEDEEETKKPVSKRKPAKSKKKEEVEEDEDDEIDVEESEDDDDDEDDNDDDDNDDDDEDDNDDDDSDDDDEDDDDEDDDDDDDEDDEDEDDDEDDNDDNDDDDEDDDDDDDDDEDVKPKSRKKKK